MEWDKIPVHPFKARLNARAECNYGILKWLELGGYLGFVRYYDFINSTVKKKVAFAPTFGANVNIHLLPFWVRNRDCRWELYVTAKYGGAYLINHIPFSVSSAIVNSQDTTVHYVKATYDANRYRHEFGIGIGGGVYFWKIFGLYFEAMVGQYSYFPEACKSNYTVRVGVELKFTHNKREENKNKKIMPKHIEM